MNKVPNRNDICPCGSGKKYKKCCGFNLDVKKQLKAKISAQGPFARVFGKSADSLAKDFFKNVKVTPISSNETSTALDKMKEKNNKAVEEKFEV